MPVSPHDLDNSLGEDETETGKTAAARCEEDALEPLDARVLRPLEQALQVAKDLALPVTPLGESALEDVERGGRARSPPHRRGREGAERRALLRDLVQQVADEVDNPRREDEHEEVREPRSAAPEFGESALAKPEARAHSSTLSSCFSPWLMLEKMTMRMTPSTMNSVPRISDCVTAAVSSASPRTHESPPASTRTRS